MAAANKQMIRKATTTTSSDKRAIKDTTSTPIENFDDFEAGIQRVYSSILEHNNFDDSQIELMKTVFFVYEKTDAKLAEASHPDEEVDDESTILKKQAAAMLKSQTDKTDKKFINKPLTINDISREKSTIGIIALLWAIHNKIDHIREKNISKIAALPIDILDSIAEFEKLREKFPSKIEIDEDDEQSVEILKHLGTIGIGLQTFHISLAKLSELLSNHIKGANELGATHIKFNHDIVANATHPHVLPIGINADGYIVSGNRFNYEITKATLAISLAKSIPSVSFAANKKGERFFLPRGMISVIEHTLPSIGVSIKAVNPQTKKNKDGEFVKIPQDDVFKHDFMTSEFGQNILNGDNYCPKTSSLETTFKLSLRILSALLNTMLSRNHNVNPNCPRIPIKLIETLAYNITSDEFSRQTRIMTDKTFISTSVMMSCISTILISALLNPQEIFYEILNNINTQISDYEHFMTFVKDESKDSKYHRVANANNALNNVVNDIEEIFRTSGLLKSLEKVEKRVIGTFVDEIKLLFFNKDKTQNHNSYSKKENSHTTQNERDQRDQRDQRVLRDDREDPELSTIQFTDSDFPPCSGNTTPANTPSGKATPIVGGVHFKDKKDKKDKKGKKTSESPAPVQNDTVAENIDDDWGKPLDNETNPPTTPITNTTTTAVVKGVWNKEKSVSKTLSPSTSTKTK